MKSIKRALSGLTKKSQRLVLIAGAFLFIGGSSTVIVSAVSCSTVSECESRISSLNSKNSTARNLKNHLANKANDYKSTIAELQDNINQVQSEINKSEAKQKSLQQKIESYQAKIEKQKQLLADDIKAMYVKGDMTNLEMLASSKDLSDYVDQQEYRNVIQNKMQDSLSQIKDLKAKVSKQKAKVDELISQQKQQRSQLAATKAKKDQLLAYNQQQQANYTANIQANQAKINRLQEERAAAIAAISGGNGQSRVGSPIRYKNFWTAYSRCGAGYSFCSAYWDQRVYSNSIGSGLAHECVNFVADWLARHGYDAPYNAGNANQWPSYSMHVSPSHVRVGDVAYMPLAPVGHVGVVTAVNGDGSFHISQMNWPIGGYYSEMDLYPQNVTFIRFSR